jgi:Arc/MetJ-type ribon-helix-helix transcriptional regulator
MNLTLHGPSEAILERLLASGRYRDSNEVVEAGLLKLEDEGKRLTSNLEQFPPGSLRESFTVERNAEELSLLKSCSLLVEDE